MNKKKSLVKMIREWARAEGIKIRITPLPIEKPKPNGKGGKHGN
jgi:hypothetical protein